MANITIPFYEAIEIGGGFIERENGMMIPRNTRIGLEYYPIFDERHRDTLNSHIVSRYYNREIGHSSVAEFRMRLQGELALNMPTFNKMYEANLLEFDPLTSMRMSTESESDTDATARNEGVSDVGTKGKSVGRTVQSDTPHQRLRGDGDYASGANDAHTWSDGESLSKEMSTAENSQANRGKSVTTGYATSPAALVRQRQELLLNVDAMVVASLDGLFLQMWNTYDNYTEGVYHAN